jgi:hypothetical protein
LSSFAEVVEQVEMSAETYGRRSIRPDPVGAVRKAQRHQDYELKPTEVRLLKMRYWMFYAAGLYNPDEASDCVIRSWNV